MTATMRARVIVTPNQTKPKSCCSVLGRCEVGVLLPVLHVPLIGSLATQLDKGGVTREVLATTPHYYSSSRSPAWALLGGILNSGGNLEASTN